MTYRLQEFIGELSRNYGQLQRKQSLPSFLATYSKLKEEVDSDDLSQYERLLLSLNDCVRVEQHTPYKIHKGYPSPRSIYPLKLFVVTHNGYYVSKNDKTEMYECYRNDSMEADVGDIIIGFEDTYPSHYDYIKKSLLLLEMGHLLYNLLFIAKEYGKQYRYERLPSLGVRLRLEQEEEKAHEDKKIQAFLQRCQERNSGTYLYPITSFCLTDVDDEIDEYALYNLISTFFSRKEEREAISVHIYKNKGEGIYKACGSEEEIYYKQLNDLYPFINFYGASHFIVISLDHDVFRYGDGHEYMLMIGMIAQHLCLHYSSKKRYCRPIKSFNINDLENMFKMEYTKQTPYYCLVTGGQD